MGCLLCEGVKTAYATVLIGYIEILTHWGRVTHICIGNLAIIVSDNGLSPGRYQAIIWNNTGILLIGIVGTNFSEILIGIHTFSFKKMHLDMSSAKRRPFCLGLNVLSETSDIFSIQVSIILECRPEDVIDGKSTLVQAMAWSHQVTSHYLNQCWPRFLMLTSS